MSEWNNPAVNPFARSVPVSEEDQRTVERAAQLDAYRATVDRTIEKEKQLRQAMADTSYRQKIQELQELTEANRKIQEVERQRLQQDRRRAGLADGSTLGAWKNQAALRIENERLALAERRQVVESGGYAGQLRAARELRRETSQVERQERRAALQERFGTRWGGWIDRYGGIARTGSHIAGAGLGVGMAYAGSMVRRGFSGTVEYNQFSMAFERTSRSLADAFKPALDTATGALHWLNRVLDGVSASQQKWIGRVGVALAGLGSFGIGMAFLSRFSTMLGGPSAAAFLSRAAPSVAARLGLGEVLAGGAGSAIFGAGGRLSGGGGTVVVPPGGSVKSGGRLKTTAKIGGVLAAAKVASDATSDESWYKLYREAGYNKIHASINQITRSLMEGSGLADVAGWISGYTPEMRRNDIRNQKSRSIDSKETKSKLTLSGGGFEEVGQGRLRIAEGVLDSARPEELKVLEQIRDKLPDPSREPPLPAPKLPRYGKDSTAIWGDGSPSI